MTINVTKYKGLTELLLIRILANKTPFGFSTTNFVAQCHWYFRKTLFLEISQDTDSSPKKTYLEIRTM